MQAVSERFAANRPSPASVPAEKFLWIFLADLWLFFYIFRFFSRWAPIIDLPSIGALASGLVDGLASPLWNYQYDTHPGSLIYGLLLYPVYLAFGSSFLWVKMLGALSVIGGIVFWTLFVRRVWDSKAALIFFLWTIFPPPTLTYFFHEFYAVHTESLFFSGLLFYLFTRLDPAGPRFWESLALGALAGVAVFVSPENLPVAGALAVATIGRWRRRGFVRLIWPAAIGFAVGYLPAFYTPLLPDYSLHPTAGHSFIDVSACWGHWRDFFFRILPRCAAYKGPVGGVLSLAWALLCGAGVVAMLRDIKLMKPAGDGRQWWVLAVLLHLFFYVFAFGFFKETVKVLPEALDYERFLTTIFFPLFVAASCLLLRLRPAARWLIFAPFLAAGFINTVSGIEFTGTALVDGYREFHSLRGDNYLRYITSNLHNYWENEGQALASVAKLPTPWRNEGYVEVGKSFPSEAAGRLITDNGLPEYLRREVAIGVGYHFAPRIFTRSGQTTAEPPAELARLKLWSKAAAQGFAVGVGRAYCFEKFGRVLDGVSGRAAALKPIVRKETEKRIAALRELLPQLSDREIYLAILEGAGHWVGEQTCLLVHWHSDLNDETIRRELAFGEMFFREPNDAEAMQVYRENLAAGLAAWLKGAYNSAVLNFSALDEPTLAEAFRRQHIKLTGGTNAHEYFFTTAE